jgi:hypothetical protein
MKNLIKCPAKVLLSRVIQKMAAGILKNPTLIPEIPRNSI